ncbi:MAG: hypothetical protein N2Z65_05315, partial [Clostridiales bacterium]|nr:hypothetical protein [Clostridiales bacterium]
MLYGIPTRERSSAGYLAEKERFRPWAGGSDAYGRLTVSYKGRNIILERTFSETGRTKAFLAYYEDTGSDVSIVNEENCGEILCGVGREAFEKSCFITHQSMACADSREIDRKIQALATSGDESSSYHEARAFLERMKNDIRLNKAKGMIPRLEAKLADLDGKITTIQNLARNETLIRAKLITAERMRDDLKKKMELIESYEAYDRSRQLEMAHSQTEQNRREFEEAKRDITFDGRLIDRTFISEITELIASLREKKRTKDALFDLVFQNQTEYEQAASELNSFNKPENTRKFPVKTAIIIALLAAIGAVLSAVFSQYLFLGILTTVFIAALGYGCLKQTAQKKQYTLYEQAKAAWDQLEQTVRDKKLKYQEANSRFQTMNEEYGASLKTLIGIAEFLGFSGKTPDEMINEIKNLDQKMQVFTDLHFKMKAAENTETALKQAITNSQFIKPVDERPEGELNDYKEKLHQTETEYAALFAEINAIKGRMQQIGDLFKLESEKETLLTQINRLQLQYAALEEAALGLNEASEELSKRVSPLLARTAGDYFSKITGGKYSKVLVKQGLKELLAAQDDGQMREILWFSQGTADQLYLSLRLALCDLILQGDAPAPLILDDLFMSFDDDRLRYALSVLKDISKRRQILLFSCQQREQALLSKLK